MASEASIAEAATYPRGFSRDTDWKWPMVPARKLVTLNYGRALKADIRSPGKVPVYGTNGQCGCHNKSLAKAPGLILGRKGQGPLGVEWCEKDFWVIDTAYYASTLTPDIDLKYLYHVVKYIGLNHLKDGTSNPTLSRDTFGAQLFPLPPLSEQKRIAHILGTLDDKIELNRRMNATVEAMAQALFQSWFVDFDPVRRNAEGATPRPEDFLFPDSFEDSAMGEIPKGWGVKPLSELCTLGRGASPRPINDYMDGEVPWIKIADATAAAGPFLFETKERVKKAGAAKSVPVVPGDLILSNSATCGVPIFVEFHGCIHDGWLYFKNLHSISKLYLFHVLIELADHLISIADGSVQKNLNTALVGQQNVLVPPQVVLNTFESHASGWFDRIRANSLESRTLSDLRDTLLPSLLSGELKL